MKKLLLSAILVLSSSALFAQSKLDYSFKPIKVDIIIYKTADSVYHKVNWIETTGTKEEVEKEIVNRYNLKSEYKADGYSFAKIVDNPKSAGLKGRFLLFIKSK